MMDRIKLKNLTKNRPLLMVISDFVFFFHSVSSNSVLGHTLIMFARFCLVLTNQLRDHSFKTSACLRGGGVSPCADGPKVTVHKDQKSPS